MSRIHIKHAQGIIIEGHGNKGNTHTIVQSRCQTRRPRASLHKEPLKRQGNKCLWRRKTPTSTNFTMVTVPFTLEPPTTQNVAKPNIELTVKNSPRCPLLGVLQQAKEPAGGKKKELILTSAITAVTDPSTIRMIRASNNPQGNGPSLEMDRVKLRNHSRRNRKNHE